jgi:uncharacterized protein
MHFSQLTFFLLPYFASILAPLIIWKLMENQIKDLDIHAKKIVNWQISMMLYTLISVILTVYISGFVILAILGFTYFFIPLINGFRVRKGKTCFYPLAFKFY